MAAAGGSYGGYLIRMDRDADEAVPLHREPRRRLRHAVAVRERRDAGRAQSFAASRGRSSSASISGIPRASRPVLETPMLVLHGERDYRVP
jgi:hypothetical protein